MPNTVVIVVGLPFKCLVKVILISRKDVACNLNNECDQMQVAQYIECLTGLFVSLCLRKAHYVERCHHVVYLCYHGILLCSTMND